MAGEFRYLGVGEEGDFGTAVGASLFLDFLSTSLESPADSMIVYEGAGGRGPLLAVPGPYIPSGDIQLGVDIEDAIYFLKWVMGRYGTQGTDAGNSPPQTTLSAAVASDSTTGAVNSETDFSVGDYVQIDSGIGGDVVQISALDGGVGPTHDWVVTGLVNPHAPDSEVKSGVSPFTHMFRPTTSNALPSFTVQIGKGIFKHLFTGATIDRLSLSLERGFVTCTANLQCQKDSQVALNSASKSVTRNILTFRQRITLL